MAKRGHTEGHILRALHQAESGTRISDICHEHGISEATYYIWKKNYAWLGLNELRELWQLRKGERDSTAPIFTYSAARSIGLDR